MWTLFSVRTGLIQLSMFKESISVVTEKPDEGGVSSFQALMVSTASRVGTGNIVGVSNAICLGGYGAVFLDVGYSYNWWSISVYRIYSCSNLQEKR